MWILTQDGLNLINADKFSIVKKADSQNEYNIYSNGIKLATYPTLNTAKKILHKIYICSLENKNQYEMPYYNINI